MIIHQKSEVNPVPNKKEVIARVVLATFELTKNGAKQICTLTQRGLGNNIVATTTTDLPTILTFLMGLLCCYI